MPSQRLGLLQITEGKQITLPEKKKKEDTFHHSPIKSVTIKVVIFLCCQGIWRRKALRLFTGVTVSWYNLFGGQFGLNVSKA